MSRKKELLWSLWVASDRAGAGHDDGPLSRGRRRSSLWLLGASFQSGMVWSLGSGSLPGASRRSTTEEGSLRRILPSNSRTSVTTAPASSHLFPRTCNPKPLAQP